jgi:excisionase family DNA binding protein
MAMEIDPRQIDPQVIYNLQEVARFLQVSYSTVLKLREENKLRSLKIGNRYYVEGRDILEHLENI